MTSPVRIPADVDMADRVIGSLTARQVLILAATALGLYTAWEATRAVLVPVVFLAGAVPVAVTAIVLALGRRDGLSMDRLVLAAIRHRLAPRIRIAPPTDYAGAAIDGVGYEAPAWLAARARPTEEPTSHRRRGVLRMPASSVTAGRGGADVGVVDLGADGLAVVAVASTVNFALRTPTEQQSLVATFGRYLHSLSAPVQALVRAQPLDLTGQVNDLRARAEHQPHPALRAAAREHADYLTRLAGQGLLLRRQVLLVLREPATPTGTADGLSSPSPLSTARSGLASLLAARAHRPRSDRPDDNARRAAEARLVRRLTEAIELLTPAGITITPLDAARTTAVLAATCNPDPVQVPHPSHQAGADDIVHAAPDPTYWDGDGHDDGHDDRYDDRYDEFRHVDDAEDESPYDRLGDEWADHDDWDDRDDADDWGSAPHGCEEWHGHDWDEQCWETPDTDRGHHRRRGAAPESGPRRRGRARPHGSGSVAGGRR